MTSALLQVWTSLLLHNGIDLVHTFRWNCSGCCTTIFSPYFRAKYISLPPKGWRLAENIRAINCNCKHLQTHVLISENSLDGSLFLFFLIRHTPFTQLLLCYFQVPESIVSKVQRQITQRRKKMAGTHHRLFNNESDKKGKQLVVITVPGWANGRNPLGLVTFIKHRSTNTRIPDLITTGTSQQHLQGKQSALTRNTHKMWWSDQHMCLKTYIFSFFCFFFRTLKLNLVLNPHFHDLLYIQCN